MHAFLIEVAPHYPFMHLQVQGILDGYSVCQWICVHYSDCYMYADGVGWQGGVLCDRRKKACSHITSTTPSLVNIEYMDILQDMP